MRVSELKLKGVLLVEPVYFEDYRGYYSETYSKRTLAQYGIIDDFVQDNHILTLKEGTLRAIHFQNQPKAQSKLVRCTRGVVFDVAVDLRKNSPTYKMWVSTILSHENRKQIYIPKGFGHGFITLCDNSEVQYKVDELYEPKLDRSIAWNDPEINIKWPISNPILSEKDMTAPNLCNSDVNYCFEGGEL